MQTLLDESVAVGKPAENTTATANPIFQPEELTLQNPDNMNTANALPQTDVQTPIVTPFFDESTNTMTYIVKDPDSNACAIIDSVWDFDYASGVTSYESADRLIECIRQNNLRLIWQIETHVHADHLSAAPYIQQQLGGRIGIGSNITSMQEFFAEMFNEGAEFQRDGSQFDHLFEDGEVYQVGNLNCFAMSTPGHTPACMTHVIGDAVFVGDTLFMPDVGTARADFPDGDAKLLFKSIQKILSLPKAYRVFVCHDYMPNDRELAFESSIGEQRELNIHINDEIDVSTFLDMRKACDKTLEIPILALPSLQINIRGGRLPDCEHNGTTYLKIPLNLLK